MSIRPAIAAVDWGTTRMRVWLLDAAGRPLAERRSDDGLITAQSACFSAVLERQLAIFTAPKTLPAIICGMAGSREGWAEAPYVDIPASIGTILKNAARVPDERRDIRIVPGLAQRRGDSLDVMRGEETQLAGARLPDTGRHIVCMPGTHSKWVIVEDGAVAGFGTWPTGELFAVLTTHSILRHSTGATPAAVSATGSTFRRWCNIALAEDGDIAPRLFSIRAAGLLQGLSAEDAAACLSGLLIGGEIASARRRHKPENNAIVLIASGSLGALYSVALGIAGFAIEFVDADEAVRIGLVEAARENGMIASGAAA